MGHSAIYHVGSGSFEVGSMQHRTLRALLGTCVGIAVFDKKAGVGGIIHLLLPEPINRSTVDMPERYATTGMPLFLNRLKSMGADPSRMKAVVAGGALVGPLTPQDMDLDIGGRTAELAIQVLERERITIVQWETGGFFTCRIDLNMQNWKWEILPAGFDEPAQAVISPNPTNFDVQQAIASVRPIPQVALRVLRIVQEEAYDIEKIAEEVKKDQVISAKTIHLCNSALFSKRREVMTLDHALVYLGQELFVKLIISAAVQSYYDQCGNGYSLCKGGLYHHAIGTAMTAEKIAEMAGHVNPGIAYTAGLLHDIGKVVLDQYIVDAYPMLYREFQNRQSEMIDVEFRILGMDHTRVGEILAKTWFLPDELTDAIRYHHQPEESPVGTVVTPIVYLADLLMSRFNTGLELERIGTGSLKETLARNGLSSTHFNALVDSIPARVFEPVDETM
jgi:putative nucleotidyltransferase with HDIG domain